MPFRGSTPAEIDAVIDAFLPVIAAHPHDPLADAPNMTFAQIETASAAAASISNYTSPDAAAARRAVAWRGSSGGWFRHLRSSRKVARAGAGSGRRNG